jgi:hypothetical protein
MLDRLQNEPGSFGEEEIQRFEFNGSDAGFG